MLASVLVVFALLVDVGTYAAGKGVWPGWLALQTNRAGFIAALAEREADDDRPIDAMLLGLEGLPDLTSPRLRDRLTPAA